MSGVNTSTTPENESDSTSDHRTFIYFAVVSVFIVLGNAATLVVICKRRRKKPTDLLLGVLAVTDLLIPILVFPLLIAHSINGRWSGGRPSCYLNAFTSMLLLKFSMFIACIIAVDRFLAIGKPFIYRRFKINSTRVKIAVVIGAFYSMSISLIPLVGMISGRSEPNWHHLCFYHWPAGRLHPLTAIYVVLSVIDTSLAAFAVLVCNIGVIIYFLEKRKSRKIQSVLNSSGNEPAAWRRSKVGRRREDLKYARLMVVVSLYFLLCFIPIQVLIILYQYGGISLEPQSIVIYQLHIVSINLLFNPLLHALIRKQYRNAYWFILRHPTILCGCSSNHQFDFDQKDPSDLRTANLRELSLAVIAVSRFRANARRIHTGPNGVARNLKTVPKIKEFQFNKDATMSSAVQGLSSYSSCANSDLGPVSSATECSESMPVNQLRVPSISLRRTSGTSYFSDLDSVPPSPLLNVPLPNFTGDTSATSDLESDVGTVCSHLGNEWRLSVPSIFSEPPSDETPQSATTPQVFAPVETSPYVLPDNTSQESGSIEDDCLKESDNVKTAWLPEEYVKPAQEIHDIVVKRSKKKKKRKRKMSETTVNQGTNVPT